MINYEMSARSAFKSALYDPAHPAASVMHWLRRKGAGAFELGEGKSTGRGHAHSAQDAHAHDLRQAAVQQYKWETAPLLEPQEADSLLNEPFTACIQVMRGGVRRRDIVQLEPLFEFPADLLEDKEKVSRKSTEPKAQPLGAQEPMESERRPSAPKPPVDVAKPAEPKPADDKPQPKVKDSIK
jgi:hypothetical protein